VAGLRNRLVGSIARWIGGLIGDRRLAGQGELSRLAGTIEGRVERIERELRSELAPVVRLVPRSARRARPSRR
jgi:hypothetical protein